MLVNGVATFVTLGLLAAAAEGDESGNKAKRQQQTAGHPGA